MGRQVRIEFRVVGKKRPRRDTKVTRRGRNREEANCHCDLTAEAKNFKNKSNGWEHRSLKKEASCGNGIYFDNTKQYSDVQF